MPRSRLRLLHAPGTARERLSRLPRHPATHSQLWPVAFALAKAGCVHFLAGSILVIHPRTARQPFLEIFAVPSRLSIARLAAPLFAFVIALATPSRGVAEFVYATSFSDGSLVRFNSANATGTLTTILGNGTFMNPTGLAFGSDGFLYVGVTGNATVAPSIARVDLSNNSTTTAYTFASFDVLPAGLAFNGPDLLVGRNSFFPNAGPVVELANIVGGSPTRSDYTSGGNLTSSTGLALGGNGTLYVADQSYSFPTASGPVKRFDSAGNYLNELITNGQSGGPPAWQLSGPTGLAISGNTLYTSSVMNGQILATDLTTDTTQLFVDAGFPYAFGTLALLSSGDLLSGDPAGAGNSISRFASNGSLVGSYNLGLGQVGGIAVAPVPEPGTLALAAMGIVGGLALLRRRQRATMTA